MRQPSKTAIKLLRKRLDTTGLIAYFDSLMEQATNIELRTKATAGSYSQAAATQLGEARRALVAGEVMAVQIHYDEGDCHWCDTVMRVRDSFRLVRMRQDSSAAAAAGSDADPG